MKSIILGIAGPSGSGKTTIAKKIRNKLGKQYCSIISMDNYYYDLSHLKTEKKENHNYDHPNAIDFSSLISSLLMLKKTGGIRIPIYDFKSHTRKKIKKTIKGRKFLIIEGILLFTNDYLNELLDYKIYLDTPLDICLLRRMKRDILERNRTFESISHQYLKTVRPMYLRYVKKSRKKADIIFNEAKNDIADIISVANVYFNKK